jgi:hypothetical protein
MKTLKLWKTKTIQNGKGVKIINKISGHKIKIGTVLKTWLGQRTVVDIKPNESKIFPFILNYLIFDNGMKMANEDHILYDCIYEGEK